MYKHLTREQRCEIFALLQHKATKKEIATVLKVSPSTICREIKRNSTKNGKYIWDKAQNMAQERIHRSPGNRSIDDIVKWRIVQLILDEQWSPKQISGYLAKNKGIYVSHETIYKMIRADASGKLAQNCRHKMKYKHSPARKHETKPVSIKNRVSIHDRPKEADGKRFGDWEMDLIVDKKSNAILTLVERSTNYLLAEKLANGKKAKPLAKVVWRLLAPFKGFALKTITTDNGSEFAEHEWISKQLNVPIYFADSYSAWQKGAVENENKLIRQYIPRGTDLSNINNRFLTKITKKINNRPREKLNFSNPTQQFYINFY